MSRLHIFLLLSILYHHGLLVSGLGCGVPKQILTPLGYVTGEQAPFQDQSRVTDDAYRFLGIPYAQKPIGNLRFKPPQPLENQKLNAIGYNATYYRPVCLQYMKDNPYIGSIKRAWPGFDPSKNMDEDCLYLNIYTPGVPILRYPGHRTTCTRKYPVMVYIHGGNYVAGTPVRDVSTSEYLTRQRVVLVTIQYRLGAFGFFTTGGSEAPGNLGLLDQIEALKWIQNNIDGFCGNKSSVTLLGEGTGGSSVSLHYLSPLTKGLFHRGIAVSGVALSPFALKPKPTVYKASTNLISGLGCKRHNSQLTVQCLQNKSGKAIIAANTDRYNMQPFVDNHFLAGEPKTLLEEGKFPTIPLMAGFVSNEGSNALKIPPKISNIFEYKSYLDKEFFQSHLNFTGYQAPVALDALAFEYRPLPDLGTSEAYRRDIMDMLSDYTVIAPIDEVLSTHNKHGGKTYMFEFAHRPRYHPGEQMRASSHDVVTAYMLGLPFLKYPAPKTNLIFDDSDYFVSFNMAVTFASFATYGLPNTPRLIGQEEWTAFNTSNKAYMKIQKHLAMTSNYHPLRMAFWNNYFPTLFPCNSKYSLCKKSEAARQK